MMVDTLLAQQESLTTAGTTLMVLCVGFVCGLALFCYYRLLREPRPSDRHHAPLDIDTKDLDE